MSPAHSKQIDPVRPGSCGADPGATATQRGAAARSDVPETRGYHAAVPALPLASPDEARLDPLIAVALKEARIDPNWASTVRSLATGKLSPRTLNCCGSGCKPCVNDIKRVTADVLTSLQDPAAAERRLEDAQAGLARRGARRLARGLKRRLLG